MTARVAGLLLAAGAGRRFGTQKLVWPVEGVPLVRRSAEALLASGVDEVVVVVGSEGERVAGALAGLPVRVVRADHWAEGMSASLRAGIAALADDVGAAVITLGDTPDVGAELVDPLVHAWRAGGAKIVAPSFRGVTRPPVLFARELFGELMALRGDAGARAVLDAAAERVTHVTFDRAEPRDVDTREDVGA